MKRLAAAALLFALTSSASGQALQNLANGFAVDKAYQVNDLDQIGTFNGNLSINIPLGQRYPVSSTLSYQFVLNYGGNNWTFDWAVDEWTGAVEDDFEIREIMVHNAEPGPPVRNGAGHQGNAGHGWFLSLGRLEGRGKEDVDMDDFYVSPDGAKHEFYHFLHSRTGEPDTGVKYTRDGTYLRRQVVDGLIEIQFPDGTRHRFESAGKYRLVSMVDAFGNEVTITYGHDEANCLPKDCVDDWTIQDGSRTHRVDMTVLGVGGSASSVTEEVVRKLVLSTSAGAATYTFDYEGEDVLVGISRRVPRTRTAALVLSCSCRFSRVSPCLTARNTRSPPIVVTLRSPHRTAGPANSPPPTGRGEGIRARNVSETAELPSW